MNPQDYLNQLNNQYRQQQMNQAYQQRQQQIYSQLQGIGMNQQQPQPTPKPTRKKIEASYVVIDKKRTLPDGRHRDD